MTIVIKKDLPSNKFDSEIIVRGLNNPRGLKIFDDETLLVIEAGSGDSQQADGRLLKVDLSREGGQILDVILQQKSSMNMLPVMKRDEILGLSDIAISDRQMLVSLTDYVKGSTILSISGSSVSTLVKSQGHINSIVYHPVRKSWFCVKPDSNVVIEFLSDGTERIVAQIENMSDDQDAVPVCIIYEEATQSFLVSLLSGEIGKDQSKVGIDFDKQAGEIIRVDPETGKIDRVVTGLTAPTGITLAADNTLYILELCSDFLEPLISDASAEDCLHGGFRRYSGRLLEVDLSTNLVTVVADQLDTPSNLQIHKQQIYISEGMGMPGRSIPGTNGEACSLTGYIRRLSMN